MRLFRSALVVLGALVLTVAGTTTASARPAVHYVALGDSYSSGVGAGGNKSGAGCDRSTNAYPALWATEHPTRSFAFLACAGATTSTVLSRQVPAIPATTNLVSLTVGGNDVGFSTIMQTCSLAGTAQCVSAVNAGERTATTVLPGKLDTLFNAVHARARSARVVVLDYPVFYQLNALICIGLSATSRAKINEGITVLDTVLAQAAARHRFAFSDVRDEFAPHELCGGSPWLRSVDIFAPGDSYHPTAAGQSQGYLDAMNDAVS